MDPRRLSLRTQILLIFALCLALAGSVTLFLNTYLIEGLKEEMHGQALLLLQEQGRRLSQEIARLAGTDGVSALGEGKRREEVSQQVEILLEGNKSVMAVCVLDGRGNVVMSGLGTNPDLFQVRKDKDGVLATADASDFRKIQVRLRPKHPEMRTVEVKMPEQGEASGGRIRFLVSESEIYRNMERTSQELTRRLLSVVLAFIGVLALGIYLMSRLLRSHVDVLNRNQQLDRMAYVGTLASGLAHEIRNPLNAMAVNLDVADEEVAAGEEGSADMVRRSLGIIRREVNRLNRSLTGFMAFAHPEAGRRDRTALRPVVDEVLDLLSPQVADAGVEVEVELPQDAELRADFSGLRQVLYNVVLNAVQAMSEQEAGPRFLRIGGRRESAQWFLWIEDTGPGVPEGSEQKVFEVFHTTKAAGSGFGLSIARAIIESHDGDIRMVRSRQGGSRVEIILPETGKRPVWRNSKDGD